MPFKDPEVRKQYQKEWNDRRISEGYGKALYARRVQRWKNEETLRKAVELALAALYVRDHYEDTLQVVEEILLKALEDAPEAKGKPLDYMPD